jgi:hypothetical protein
MNDDEEHARELRDHLAMLEGAWRAASFRALAVVLKSSVAGLGC